MGVKSSGIATGLEAQEAARTTAKSVVTSKPGLFFKFMEFLYHGRRQKTRGNAAFALQGRESFFRIPYYGKLIQYTVLMGHY